MTSPGHGQRSAGDVRRPLPESYPAALQDSASEGKPWSPKPPKRPGTDVREIWKQLNGSDHGNQLVIPIDQSGGWRHEQDHGLLTFTTGRAAHFNALQP